MRKISVKKAMIGTMMMVCTVFVLTAGIALAQCTDTTDCDGGYCSPEGFCIQTCGDDNDCNNGLFCDGVETCNETALTWAGLCVPGELPCGADFCDEDAAPGSQCIECDTNADCFGGVCRQSDNVCVECKNDTHCDNGRYCDGQETCFNNVCLPGALPCPGQFCNETGAGSCQTCQDDGDCFGGLCNDTNNQCIECTQDSDCDNADFCDGEETCDAGVCISGALPCDGDFCNETSDECLTCEDDADCFGGVCESNVCVECRQRSDCGNGLWCDGRETCNAGVCEKGNIRCAGEFCDEDANECLQCTEDDDCSIGAVVDGQCNETVCVECLLDTDCDDGDFCNGEETCDSISGACVSGPLPCADQFCNETSDSCQACNIDANCGVNGMCINSECVECTVNSDCGNGLWCDGWERCNAGVCEAGTPRCSGEYCDEDTNTCLECVGDDNCTGGVCINNLCYECQIDDDCESGFCSNNVCLECRNTSDCIDDLYCNGSETCNATTNMCEQVGDFPCGGPWCDEDTNECLSCLDDDDCFGGVCDGDNSCVECLIDDDCDDENIETICSVNNECVECTANGDCDNSIYCDGTETCDISSGVCVAGDIPCPGDFCNETGGGTGNCMECEVDADCYIGGDGTGRCINNVCMDCFGNEDCDNTLFCDGTETCEAGICELGEIPCAEGQFCDEDNDVCLECEEDADCFGGVCEANICIDCRVAADCDPDQNWCDGVETCVDSICVPGEIPCGEDWCDEAIDECHQCVTDEDCYRAENPSEGGRCINNVCFDCFYESDCDNGLFCDGEETCESGLCELGEIPCSGEFCDEGADTCLTCLENEDCFGGVCLESLCVECTEDGDCGAGFCVDNICVECVEDATCDNAQFCDGVETCEANTCIAGIESCEEGRCDETEDMCLPCAQDSDCGEFASCVNTECIAYPIASKLTEIKLKGPGLAEIIYEPNQFDIARIKITKTTEKSTLTIGSRLKNFPLFLGRIILDGSVKAIKGKNVILTGPVVSTGGIEKMQLKGAETGCSIVAPWIGTLQSAGDFSCDVMLTGTGSPKNWQTLGKLDIKGKIRDSELLITGTVGNAKAGFWGASATLAVGVDPGPDGIFFTDDDVATEGMLNKFKFKDHESLNGGDAFGIIANEFGKMKTPPPFVDGDFNISHVE